MICNRPGLRLHILRVPAAALNCQWTAYAEVNDASLRWHRQCYHIMLSGRFKSTAADQVLTPGRLACCRSKMAKKSLLSDCSASRQQLCLKEIH